ncbi:hypothetical protein [Kordiimonas aquimaris]|uniref:hypothetical protein n=1 Tax=Kordiimonas aquimaris TaxID=707591 RepID=UPI0021D30DDB|nr:hypothetical protein [Kordiimonas aquimaris]
MTLATNNKTANSQLPTEDSVIPAHSLDKEELLASDDLGLSSDVKSLPRVKLLLARLQVFDFFRKTTLLLTKRPFKLMTRAPDEAAVLSISLQVITQHSYSERGAVTVSAQYYTLFGRELIADSNDHTHNLFADPADNTVDQPCYFISPKGAFWIRLTMSRNTTERRIAVHGSLRPKPYRAEPVIPFEEALVSRDDVQLRLQLDAAFAFSDRVKAKQLLARLIFLWRKPEDEQTLKIITDIDELILRPCSAHNIKLQKTDMAFDYAQLMLPPYGGCYPLSKWLMVEAQRLNAALTADTLNVPDGPYFSLRLMAAAFAGAVLAHEIDAEKVTDIPWGTADEVRAYTGYFKT